MGSFSKPRSRLYLSASDPKRKNPTGLLSSELRTCSRNRRSAHGKIQSMSAFSAFGSNCPVGPDGKHHTRSRYRQTFFSRSNSLQLAPRVSFVRVAVRDHELKREGRVAPDGSKVGEKRRQFVERQSSVMLYGSNFRWLREQVGKMAPTAGRIITAAKAADIAILDANLHGMPIELEPHSLARAAYRFCDRVRRPQTAREVRRLSGRAKAL